MAVSDIVNLSGLLDEAKCFSAYQPIAPLTPSAKSMQNRL
jgi:hypothetical protein